MSQTDIAIFGIAVTLALVLIAPRIARRISEDSVRATAIRARRAEFLGDVRELKAYIEIGDALGGWVKIFIDNIPTLKSGYDKISADLVGRDAVLMKIAIDEVLAYAGMGYGDVYANRDKILETLKQFPTT